MTIYRSLYKKKKKKKGRERERERERESNVRSIKIGYSDIFVWLNIEFLREWGIFSFFSPLVCPDFQSEAAAPTKKKKKKKKKHMGWIRVSLIN